MAHINLIKSKPLSPEGRENYDRIFRKPDQCRARIQKAVDEQSPYTEEELIERRPPEFMNQRFAEAGNQASEDKQRDKARELHQALTQKQIDESA